LKKICFVCLGNVVRSPLAEALFWREVVQKGRVDNYQADSAGTSDWHQGESPDTRMRRVAARHGLIYDHRARQFQSRDLDLFDMVIAMDRENRDQLKNMARWPNQRRKIHLLREYDPDGGPDVSVPDPYYGGIDGFEDIYAIIERSVHGLLSKLEDGDAAAKL
jgi:protein-tyrosine phosphatase